MENQPNSQSENFSRSEEQAILQEILKHTRQTKNYMKWQLIITVALVVLPLLVALFAIPYAINQFSASTNLGGLLY